MIVRRLLSGGNMFTGCNTVNEYITRIFEIGLQQQYTKVIDNTEYEGYYLTIPSREKSNIKHSKPKGGRYRGHVLKRGREN